MRYLIQYGPEILNAFEDKDDAVAAAIETSKDRGVRLTVGDARHDTRIFDTGEQDHVVRSRFGMQIPPVQNYVNDRQEHYVGPYWYSDYGYPTFAWVEADEVQDATV